MEPDFPRASGFAHGRGSHEVPLRADRGNGIRFLRHDDGRFRDHDFGHHGNPRDKDERHHHHFFNDFGLVAFGLPFWWYPGYRCVDGGYPDDGHSDVDAYNDSAPAYGDEYWQDLAMKVQWVLSQRGYYDGPIDGMISPDGTRAIRFHPR